MDNKELVERLSSKLGRDKKDINKLLDALVGVVKSKSCELDSIAVPSFGTFETKKKNERIVMNPSTGKRMLVPPKITLSFKVSNVLKSKLK